MAQEKIKPLSPVALQAVRENLNNLDKEELLHLIGEAIPNDLFIEVINSFRSTRAFQIKEGNRYPSFGQFPVCCMCEEIAKKLEIE